MRRGMLIALALVIVMIGAGMVMVATTALAQPAQAGATIPPTNMTALTTGMPAQPEPASSALYGADAESEITTTAPKLQGHDCSSGY